MVPLLLVPMVVLVEEAAEIMELGVEQDLVMQVEVLVLIHHQMVGVMMVALELVDPLILDVAVAAVAPAQMVKMEIHLEQMEMVELVCLMIYQEHLLSMPVVEVVEHTLDHIHMDMVAPEVAVMVEQDLVVQLFMRKLEILTPAVAVAEVELVEQMADLVDPVLLSLLIQPNEK